MPFYSEDERKTNLTLKQERLILSAFPAGTSVIGVAYFDNYDLPCPVKVQLRLPDGREECTVLRLTRHGDAGTEADVLRTLERLGLPVPRVLAQETGMAVLSLLPGVSLQAMAMRGEEGVAEAMRLTIEGALRLAALTEQVETEPVAHRLPRRTLAMELDKVAASASPWLSDPLVQRAIARLRSLVAGSAAPLVFTNGDTQPGNFLAENGRLTGFLDFEAAGFGDFLFGFAKYPIYDMHPLNQAGFIGRLLGTTGFTRVDFVTRLALGCLMTLVREIPREGGDDAYREHVRGLLVDALSTMDE